MIHEVLLIFLVVVSLLVIFSRSLLRSLIFLSSSTVILVALFFLLQAPDVALTQAVVGTGATTVIYLLALRKVEVIR